jgi:hypothetical protein
VKNVLNFTSKGPLFYLKVLVRRDMNQKQRKKCGSDLRDSSNLGTLIKDVRDVAAAVLCSEGPGRSRNKV